MATQTVFTPGTTVWSFPDSIIHAMSNDKIWEEKSEIIQGTVVHVSVNSVGQVHYNIDFPNSLEGRAANTIFDSAESAVKELYRVGVIPLNDVVLRKLAIPSDSFS